jgi:hypothetical protein
MPEAFDLDAPLVGAAGRLQAGSIGAEDGLQVLVPG